MGFANKVPSMLNHLLSSLEQKNNYVNVDVYVAIQYVVSRCKYIIDYPLSERWHLDEIFLEQRTKVTSYLVI
ncbi:hypothetical protein EI94DRAFT_1727240 [Lactarius quietus]|nr:hypothetical protein EI94DRAFT_1727240 [Lactarius quietus]